MAQAVQMEENYRNGILPRAGGWYDQDDRDVKLIMIAQGARGRRESLNEQKTRHRKK